MPLNKYEQVEIFFYCFWFTFENSRNFGILGTRAHARTHNKNESKRVEMNRVAMFSLLAICSHFSKSSLLNWCRLLLIGGFVLILLNFMVCHLPPCSLQCKYCMQFCARSLHWTFARKLLSCKWNCFSFFFRNSLQFNWFWTFCRCLIWLLVVLLAFLWQYFFGHYSTFVCFIINM